MALRKAMGMILKVEGTRVFVSQKPGYRLSLGDANGGAKFRDHIFILPPDSSRAILRRLDDGDNPRFKEVKNLEEAQSQLQEWGVKSPEVVALMKIRDDAEAKLEKLGY